MKYIFLFSLSCASFFGLKEAEGTNSHNVTSSEKSEIYGFMEQKMEIKSIFWIGGWGLFLQYYNQREQKISIDFDRINLTAKGKDFSGKYKIPFSFKGVIPSQKIIWYIVPLNDLGLPAGRYSLSLVFEKNKETGKGSDKKIQSEPVLRAEVLDFVAPPDDYKTVSQINVSDYYSNYKENLMGTTCFPLNTYYHCFSQNGDLFVRVRTEATPDNKSHVGTLAIPIKYAGSSDESEERKYTALSRLKIKISTGKTSKTFYYPTPVNFTLVAGEKFEFSFCLKKTEWDDKNSRMEIEYMHWPDGLRDQIGAFPLPFSKMIFHKDKEK